MAFINLPLAGCNDLFLNICFSHGDLTEKPYLRIYFQPSGINVHIRYFTPAKIKQEISSNITEEIFNKIKKEIIETQKKISSTIK